MPSEIETNRVKKWSMQIEMDTITNVTVTTLTILFIPELLRAAVTWTVIVTATLSPVNLNALTMTEMDILLKEEAVVL